MIEKLQPISLGIAGVEAPSAVAMRPRRRVELHPFFREIRGPRVDVFGSAHEKPDVVEPAFARWARGWRALVKGEVVFAARQLELARARPPLDDVAEGFRVEALHRSHVAAEQRHVPD